VTETIRFAAYGYPMAEQDSAGNWIVAQPDSVSDGDWGTFRIEAGAFWNTSGGTAYLIGAGTDVTLINDCPTLIDSLSFGDYGELTGQFTLSELAPFDDPAAIGITPGGNIDIYRVLPPAEAAVAGVTEVPYWHGLVASIEMADGPGLTSSVTVQLVGALYGECMVRAHAPLQLDTSADVGTWAGRALDPALYDRPLPLFERFTFESDTTNIETRYRGSRGQSVIDYLDELLALAQDNTNGQWTIARAYNGAYPRARHYYIRPVPTNMASAIQQNTVFAGGFGVAFSLTKDVTETPTALYGEGVHPVDDSDLSGSRWRNMRYPMLTTTAPANPDRISGADFPVELGDVDADFTKQVITQLSSQMRVSGWPDVTITSTFGTALRDAIEAMKEDTPGLSWTDSTGHIADATEWGLVWSTGTGFTDLSSGFSLPLHDRNAPYEYAPDGDVIGDNPSYVSTLLRVDQSISFGENIPKSRARKYARRVLTTYQSQWVGTITLTSDPTDENGDGRSRLDIREGSWIQVNNLNGGTFEQFYVAGVTHSPETDGFPTTLTVSQTPYSLLDLATRLERNRAAKSDPAKSFYAQRTATVRPWMSVSGWDAESGAGIIAPFSAAGSAWTVRRFVGAQYGSIGALHIDMGTAVPYCFAVFGGSVSAAALGSAIPSPLGTVAGNYPSHWQHPDNAAELESWGFIEAWGSNGEAAGYYPGAQSAAGTPASSATGVLEDAGSWTFASLEPPFLYAAIWPQMAGTASAVTGRMKIVAEE
jgi:hypothetical protein